MRCTGQSGICGAAAGRSAWVGRQRLRKRRRRETEPSQAVCAPPRRSREGFVSGSEQSDSEGPSGPRTATLLVKCPDQKGVVASLAQLLYGFGCNIISSDQFSDVEANMFYQVRGWALRWWAGRVLRGYLGKTGDSRRGSFRVARVLL